MRGGLVAASVVVACGALGIAISSASPRPHDDEPPVAFTISNATSSSPTNLIPATLFPGVTRFLWYSVHNLTERRIEVTNIHIASITAPLGCPASELDLSQTNFTGALLVGPGATDTAVVPISLVDTGTNQDACEGKTFYFHFTGRAVSPYVVRTDVFLATSIDPSLVGQSVTFTAAVVLDRRDGSPTSGVSLAGTVTFFEDGVPVCTSVPVTTVTMFTSTATCKVLPYTRPGVHNLTAQYSSGAPDVAGSTSRVLVQVVLSSKGHCTPQGRVDFDGDCDGSDR